MTRYTVTVFDRYRLTIPLFGGSDSASRNVNVAYDTSKLTLTNATIRGEVTVLSGIVMGHFRLYVDGNEVWHEQWFLIGGTRTAVKDVTDLINMPKVYNFRIAAQDIGSNTVDVTVYLDLEFAELEPGAMPSIDPYPAQHTGSLLVGIGDALQLVMYLLPALIITIVVATVLSMIRGR